MLDGIAMTLKFTHLSEALQFYDPEFFEYLKQQQADDLLFCYRWLLLEMKREFAFEDSLRMLEVLWSSLPPEPPATELLLFEKEFTAPVDVPPPKSPLAIQMRAPRENAYIKLCNLRRQSSSQSLLPTSPNALKTTELTTGKSLDTTKRLNQSLDETVTRNPSAAYKHVKKTYQSLDETKMVSMLQSNEMNGVQKSSNVEIENEGNVSVNFLEVDNNMKNKQRSRSTSPSAGSDAGNQGGGGDQRKTTHSGGAKPGVAKPNMRQTRRGHFKDLKERLTAGKKGKLYYLYLSLLKTEFAT